MGTSLGAYDLRNTHPNEYK